MWHIMQSDGVRAQRIITDDQGDVWAIGYDARYDTWAAYPQNGTHGLVSLYSDDTNPDRVIASARTWSN